jgi:hypothetical protein
MWVCKSVLKMIAVQAKKTIIIVALFTNSKKTSFKTVITKISLADVQ